MERKQIEKGDNRLRREACFLAVLKRKNGLQYGHFGRDDLDLPREKSDKADVLKSYLQQQ